MTIWGSMATKFNHEVNDILIFQRVKIIDYKELKKLTSTFSTEIISDDECEEFKR